MMFQSIIIIIITNTIVKQWCTLRQSFRQLISMPLSNRHRIPLIHIIGMDIILGDASISHFHSLSILLG